MDLNKNCEILINYSSAKFNNDDIDILSLNDNKITENTKNTKKREIKRKTLSLKIIKNKAKSADDSFNISDDYEMLDTLGMGAYAYVRKARCKATDQLVAIKVCRGATSSAMLKSEFDILSRLSHSGVPRVHKFVEDTRRREAYVVMEYFDGVSVDRRVADGVMSEDAAKAVVGQLLSVVQYLHSVGVAHRDIKPENVLLSADNQVKLVDFNISKAFSSRPAAGKFKSVFLTQISSPLYCAPELKTQLGYNESVDVWGVGTVMFTLLFGTFASKSLNKTKCAIDRSV